MSEQTDRPPVLVVCADSADYLRTLADNTFHACVTDPPYGLGEPPDPADVLRQWADRGDWSPRKGVKSGGFMGCTWDRFVPGPALWREVYRVLKPGAYCAVFAAPRTWDWMSLSLRFAGFEVTDTLMWLFGQGLPAGGDVGKRIDKLLGADREVVGTIRKTPSSGGRNTHEGRKRPWAEGRTTMDITIAATPEARLWDDCSTALKPAWEPILLARKPHGSTVARCCVEQGAGALRTGACRIPSAKSYARAIAPVGDTAATLERNMSIGQGSDIGRWPANVAFDEVAADSLGNASRFFYCAKASKADRDAGLTDDARNRHPTVKPEALMRWLTRLVTPPGGELLDPFGGSGSTGKAAALEGLRATIVEREAEHAAVAEARVADALRRAAAAA